MASKASMLKQGANRTGKGLFGGMSPLNASEDAPSKIVKETDDIIIEEKVTETVNVPEVKIEPVVVKEEPTEKIVEEIGAVEPVKEEIAEEKAPVQEEIKVSVNNVDNAEKQTSAKGSSRYEKEKFLLLDIRGYRDYVEHMAKAANTSATKYIRKLIQQDMDKNMDIYEAHKALEEKLKGRS